MEPRGRTIPCAHGYHNLAPKTLRKVFWLWTKPAPNLTLATISKPDINIRASSRFSSLCSGQLKDQDNIKLVLEAEENKLISVTGMKWI